MNKSFKKITLKKETISNLSNSQMNAFLGGNISNKTLPIHAGCDSNGANCCTYNQCGNIMPTHELCNTYKNNTCSCNGCDLNSMYGVGCNDGSFPYLCND
jgi:natural product precursor